MQFTGAQSGQLLSDIDDLLENDVLFDQTAFFSPEGIVVSVPCFTKQLAQQTYPPVWGSPASFLGLFGTSLFSDIDFKLIFGYINQCV